MKDATTDIWNAFHDRLRRTIRRRVRNEQDAEDLLQEVFGRIHAGLDSLQQPEKLEAWVFQVARRAIIDHLRQRGRKIPLLETPHEVAEKSPPSSIDAELASCLPPMLEQLPRQDQDALRLTDMDGLGQNELAEKLGLSLTGAKSRIQRARKRLKAALLDCCRVETDRRGRPIEFIPRDPSCSCD